VVRVTALPFRRSFIRAVSLCFQRNAANPLTQRYFQNQTGIRGACIPQAYPDRPVSPILSVFHVPQAGIFQ
jgi:hypothetical protein